MNFYKIKRSMAQIWEKIKQFHYVYYDIKYGLQNLWAYKRIIWKDRDWDFYYLHLLMRFKLDRMQKQMDENGCSTASPLNAKQMRYAIFLLDRINAGRYHEHVGYKKAYEMEANDYRRLYRFLEKNVQKWWD